MNRYKNCVMAGKPKDVLDDLATGISLRKLTPRKQSPRKSTPKKTPVKPPLPCSSQHVSDEQVGVGSCTCWIAKSIVPVPGPAPPGYSWVPSWSCQPVGNETLPTCASESANKSAEGSANRSFEELILEKMKGPVVKPKKQRRKIDLMTKVITNDEYLQTIRQKEEPPKKKKKTPRQKVAVTEKQAAPDLQEHLDSKPDEETTSDNAMAVTEMEKAVLFPPSSKQQAIAYLRELWKNLNPPVPEGSIVGKWYAAVFLGRKSSNFMLEK